MNKIGLLIAAVLTSLVTIVSAQDNSQCHTYSGAIDWTGPTQAIYTNTSIWLCIAKAVGECDENGGYLWIRNTSSRHFAKLSSEGAGLHNHHIPPAKNAGEPFLELHRLSAYRRADGPPLTIRATVTYCKK